MRMNRSVAGCVVVVWLLALLAAGSEGHITFFSPKEMMLMKEREGRKEIEAQLEDTEKGSIQQPPPVEDGGNPRKTMEIAVRLSPKQDRVASVFDEIIHELTDGHQKAK